MFSFMWKKFSGSYVALTSYKLAAIMDVAHRPEDGDRVVFDDGDGDSELEVRNGLEDFSHIAGQLLDPLGIRRVVVDPVGGRVSPQ